jgi:pimeloyl-ACP methyl ester carboxylesterase
MPVLETPELAISYETAGRGRHAMVLVHGNFATWRWWKPILDRPARGFRLFAPTLRGFGATSAAPRARSIDVLARDLHAFVQGLGLDRVHLVGHSLGGAVALEYALCWPRTVASVALVAPAAGDGLEAMRARNDAVGMMLRWTDPTWLASRIMLVHALRWERFVGTRRDTLARALAEMMPSAEPGAIQFDALLADALAIDETVVVDTYEALRRWDVRPRLPALALPVRVLAGARDALVPLASLEALTRALPRARLEVWDDVGHSPQLEKPAEFATWLARVRPSPLAQLRQRLRGLFLTLRRWLLRRAGASSSG